jgi:pyruvate ferredoxin oxidoreductase gamma subunit
MVISQVEEPDLVVVLDQTLLQYPAVTEGLNQKGWLVVNSRRHPEELEISSHFNIATADATRICQELGLIVAGLPVVNTAILGALVHATKIVDISSIDIVIKERFAKSNIKVNLIAIKKTSAITKLVKTGEG